MAEEEGPDQDQANGVDAAKESGHDIVREDLDDHEREIVSSHEVASARLVHEIIRQRGIDELERPASALLWSAIAAGFVIGLSPFAIGIFTSEVADGPWMPLLMALGYAIGFIAVISGRLQLFTESTITAVIPLATCGCGESYWRAIWSAPSPSPCSSTSTSRASQRSAARSSRIRWTQSRYTCPHRS